MKRIDSYEIRITYYTERTQKEMSKVNTERELNASLRRRTFYLH